MIISGKDVLLIDPPLPQSSKNNNPMYVIRHDANHTKFNVRIMIGQIKPGLLHDLTGLKSIAFLHG